MPTPSFIDLSHHNTVPESFEKTMEAGIIGVIHKATEGGSYVDDKMDNRRYMAKDAGMLWGVYHFVRPGDMHAQVEHFLNASAPYCDDDTLYVLDWEDAGVSLDDAIEFLELLEERTGRSPVLYSGHVVKDALKGEPDERINRFRLWLCHYTTGTPVLPPGWDQYWGWQYTDKGEIPGVTPPTDLNVYGGEAELADDWSGAEPEPEPEPEGIQITLIVPPGVNVHVITAKD